MSFIAKFIHDTVHSRVGWPQILFALAAVFLLRTILELSLDSERAIVYYGGTYQDVVIFANAFLSWLCTFLLLGLIFRAYLPLDTLQVFRLLATFSPVICIVPLIDYLFSSGAGANIYYGHGWGDFLYNYFNLFNPFATIHIVPVGVRIEILLVIVSSLLVARLGFQLPRKKALLLALSIYSAIFLLGYLPALYGSLFALFGVNAGSLFDKTNTYFYMYLPLFLALAMAMVLRLKHEYAADGRLFVWLFYPSRLLFYLVSLGFGFLSAINKADRETFELIYYAAAMLAASLAVAFLFACAKILNDIHDIEIDRISNRQRPLVSGKLVISQAYQIALVCFAVSLLFAVSINVYFLVLWGLTALLSYLYSAPPIRLRRFYPLPNLVIATIGAVLYYAGYTIVAGKITFPHLMSQGIVDKVFIAFFILSHLKDAKDTEGDRANRIFNLFNFIKYSKPLGILILTIFAATVYAIGRRLGIDNMATAVGIVVFLGAAIRFIVMQQDIRKFDRLFLACFILLLYLTGVWLQHG